MGFRPLLLDRKGLHAQSALILQLRRNGAIFYPLTAKKNTDPNMRIWMPPGRYTELDYGTLRGLQTLGKLVAELV